MTFLILLFLIFLVLSAFFAGSEMAFVSGNYLKLRDLADSGHPAAKKILKLQEKSHHFLSALLIGNNLAQVGATAVLAYLLEAGAGWRSEWAVTAISAPFLIILGEMVPKDYCRIRAESVLLKYADALSFFQKLWYWPVEVLLKGLHALLGRSDLLMEKSIFVSEQEFRMLIEEGAQTGVLSDHEKQLIGTILDFHRIHLTSVMIPLEHVVKADITATIGDVKNLARRSGAPMILVYEEIPSLVVGMIYIFDILFEEDEGKHLKDYLRSPIFLPGNTSSQSAFLTLQQKHQSYAVVIDANAEAVGVIPIERLVEF